MNIKIRAFHSSVIVYIYLNTSKSNIGKDGFLKFVQIMLYCITDERCGGGGIMTIQQEATNLIYCLPDENVKLIVDVMRKMLKPVIEGTEKNKSLDTSKRIGLGKGIINDPEGFDVWNSEISDLFEGTDI